MTDELWIDCPICETKGVTSHMKEMLKTSDGVIFECSGCGTSYKLKEGRLYIRTLELVPKNEWHFWKPE